jgi:hypothetical protein
MKKLRILIIIIPLLGIIIYCLPLVYLALQVRPTESYPGDTSLDSLDNRNALIIMAHHDDSYGTVAVAKWLCDRGWDVRAFYFRAPSYQRDTVRELNGIESTGKVVQIIGLKEFTMIGQPLRKDSVISDMNVPYGEFDQVFRRDTIERIIAGLISTYRPSVIFTLDDQIGLYGHSDHVFVSRAILNLCRKHQSDDQFPVTMIYQSVLPPSMAEGVMVKYQKLHYFHNFWGMGQLIRNRGFGESVYTKAKKIYACDGMPPPDVQFRIDSLSVYKKRFLESWARSEKKNLKRFVPFSYWYPHRIYFKMFNYEYFRTIRLTEQPERVPGKYI